jgi:hypothetical protein
MSHVTASSDLSSDSAVDCVHNEEYNFLYFTNLVHTYFTPYHFHFGNDEFVIDMALNS